MCPDCGRPLPADGGPCAVCTLTADGSTAPPEAVAAPGVVAGRYLLQRLLGRGGAKEVWLAHDLTLDRGVALARVSGQAAWERLRREARLTARLGGHRHIVTVHDVFDDAGTPCLVARYMTGGSLADRLDAQPGRRLAPRDAIRAAREVADALAHAHAHGVVHRDVKPDNVWLDADGDAALGDFGVAVVEGEPAASAGTRRYAAPEQLVGEPATPLSDLFALGVTLYELLTGERPFATGDLVRARPPAPPSSRAADVPEALDDLVLALVAHDPARRPEDAATVSAALAGMLGAALPAGLVGREGELERLRGELGRAWAGAARTVLVAGEAGIGKTTLLQALEAEAERRGGAVLWGRAEPDERAYGVWRAVLRDLPEDPVVARLLGGGGAPGDGEDRLRLFDAVAAALAAAAAQQPLVVVLEDLHWADASSLRLLEHVVDAEPGAPLLLAGSYRPGEAASVPRGETLELAGLAPDAVRALLPAGVGDVLFGEVLARTGGNPFYVSELARLFAAGGEGIPERVREVVRRRIDRLGTETGAVLEAAAVAGRFTIAELARAAGVPRPAVVAAVDCGATAGLLAPAPDAPGQFAFAHALVRDAVREALPAQRRGALHEAIADALAARRDAGADVSAARIAHHALGAARLGGDPQPAWAAALEAAREAEAALGHAEAATHYASALEALALGAEAPAAERRGTLFTLADAAFAAGDIESARRRYAQAAAAARREGDAEALARAALGFSRVYPYGVADTEGATLLADALAALPDADGALRARVLGLTAVFEPAQPRREALIDEALAMARRLGDEATVGWIYPAALDVEWRPERAQRRAEAAEAVVRAAARHADHGALVWAYLQRIRDALQAGDVARADADLDRARSVAAAARRSQNRWVLMVAEAGRAAFAGRLDEAERLTEEALELNRRHGDDCYQEHTVGRLVLARLRWRPREVDVAALRGFAARYPHLPVWEAMLASLEWDLGDADAARRSVAVCADDGFAAVAGSPDFLPAALSLADPVAGAGEPWQVERLYALLAPHERSNPVLMFLWGVFGPAARGLGLLAAADDRPRDAAAHFAEALRLCEAWDAPGWELRSIGDWLATGVPAGDRDALVRRGLLLARVLGLPGVAARIADVQTITP
ncbi:MAG TPA: AAA family ATPase [Solirubrobacter sp.]|nr:AAA family ATPase [Solirubrobacter sp.]